jgi:hypothetical protein
MNKVAAYLTELALAQAATSTERANRALINAACLYVDMTDRERDEAEWLADSPRYQVTMRD